MPAVYFIASYDVTDPDRYEREYVPGAIATLKSAGAEVVVASGSAATLEGAAANQHVVFEFPSYHAFHSWYDGPSFEPLRRLRDETTSNRTAVLATRYRG